MVASPPGSVPDNHRTLAAKVAFLLRRAFPDPPEAVETHMSWVFLTADRAYKLKKPVRHSFLDYRTLDARRRDCRAEVDLNRPLAPGVYLGTVPLTWDPTGQMRIDGAGEILDWLVVMRRLPNELLLDARIADASWEPADLLPLARHLADFYRDTTALPRSSDDHRRALREILRIDRAELVRPEHHLPQDRVNDLIDALCRAIGTHPELSDRAGRVVDGHGDLRPEHVLVGPQPLVIDRITFDPGLRTVDPLFDLALLGVECERLGAGQLEPSLIGAYQQMAGDPATAETIALYHALRAVTRARLSIAHLVDDGRDAQKWLDRTDAYLLIAERHLDAFNDRCRDTASR